MRARRAPARKPRRRPARRKPPVRLKPRVLGQAVELRYVHDSDGKRYRHKFGSDVNVLHARFANGEALLIFPVTVQEFIQ